MRRIFPDPLDPVDAYEAYRLPAGVAHVRVNMVMSADGAATDRHGRSGGLGGDGDHEVFRTLRALADGILVGAGTVRAEGYGPHRVRADLAEHRRQDGRPPVAPIIVVSRSLMLDYAAPLFTEAQTPTIVLTCESAPSEGLRAAAKAGRVMIAGSDELDLAEGLRQLRQDAGLSQLLCEGGPHLNVPLFSEGLADELCLTLSPLLMGGAGLRIISGLVQPQRLALTQAYEHDGELYLRYTL